MSPVTQAAAEDATPAAPIAESRRVARRSPRPPPNRPAARNPAPVPQSTCRARLLDDEQVADWLHAHPDFFDRHADVLSEVKLRHPHGGRAISLVERQVLVLRERNKALESRMAELIRIGQENDGIGRGCSS